MKITLTVLTMMMIMIFTACGNSGGGGTIIIPPLNPTGTYHLTLTEQSGGTCNPGPLNSDVSITDSGSSFTWADGKATVNVGAMACTDSCAAEVNESYSTNYPVTGDILNESAYFNVHITSTTMTGTMITNAVITDSFNNIVSSCSGTYNISGTKQ